MAGSYKEIELKSGVKLRANILAKTITAIVVRTEDNRYFLVSRDVLVNSEQFKFRD